MTDTKDEEKSDDLAVVMSEAELLWLRNSSDAFEPDAVTVGVAWLLCPRDTNEVAESEDILAIVIGVAESLWLRDTSKVFERDSPAAVIDVAK